MSTPPGDNAVLRSERRIDPAVPLWRLSPTHADDGQSLADFMMLVPGLAGGGETARRHVTDAVRSVCEDFGDAVAFAEVNYKLNTLWVSVAAEPGLTARVASEIRQRLPDALLIGGQLGAVPTLTLVTRGWRAWLQCRLSGLSATLPRRLLANRD